MDLPLIHPVDVERAATTARRIDELTKPPGSLGRLENLAVRLSAIAPLPAHGYRRRAILLGAADHGVTDADVSAYPADVTQAMVGAFIGGIAAINAFARSAGATVTVANFGMRRPPAPASGVLDFAIGYGTANFALTSAMSEPQAEAALAAGIRAAEIVVTNETPEIVALGEMGIGNTTSAAALICALTGADPKVAVGRGTGIDDGRFAKKHALISGVLRRMQAANYQPRRRIAEVGGFEIVGLAGALIGFAARGIPILLDGVSIAAAALIAREYAPGTVAYMIAAHRSVEPAQMLALRALGLEPLLDLGLRLGEGTGAALAFGLCDAAARMVTEMRTFAEAGVAAALTTPPA